MFRSSIVTTVLGDAMTRGIDALFVEGYSGTDVEVREVLHATDVFSSGSDAVAIGQVRPLIPLQIDPPEHKAYRKVLELHGWGDLHTELHRLSLQGQWDAMGTLIDDEVLDAFAVVAPLDQVAAKIRDRCDGVIDRVLVARMIAVRAQLAAARSAQGCWFRGQSHQSTAPWTRRRYPPGKLGQLAKAGWSGTPARTKTIRPSSGSTNEK